MLIVIKIVIGRHDLKIIIIGYWFDMKIYVLILVQSNIARCQ